MLMSHTPLRLLRMLSCLPPKTLLGMLSRVCSFFAKTGFVEEKWWLVSWGGALKDPGHSLLLSHGGILYWASSPVRLAADSFWWVSLCLHQGFLHFSSGLRTLLACFIILFCLLHILWFWWRELVWFGLSNSCGEGCDKICSVTMTFYNSSSSPWPYCKSKQGRAFALFVSIGVS